MWCNSSSVDVFFFEKCSACRVCVCVCVCLCVCVREKEGKGKEWRFEAPAKRICLAAVSFRRVKDYGRITTNEWEDPHTHMQTHTHTQLSLYIVCVCVCVCVCVSKSETVCTVHSSLICCQWLSAVAFTAAGSALVTVYLRHPVNTLADMKPCHTKWSQNTVAFLFR